MRQIILKGDYYFYINDTEFGIQKIYGVDKTYYRIFEISNLGKWSFEDYLENFCRVCYSNVRGFCDLKTSSQKNKYGYIDCVTFDDIEEVKDYIIIELRHLLQDENNSIEIVIPNEELLNRLKKFGLTVAPLGDKLMLYPDLSSVEQNTNSKHETVLDDDSILTINVRKRKSLKLDFKE